MEITFGYFGDTQTQLERIVYQSTPIPRWCCDVWWWCYFRNGKRMSVEMTTNDTGCQQQLVTQRPDKNGLVFYDETRARISPSPSHLIFVSIHLSIWQSHGVYLFNYTHCCVPNILLVCPVCVCVCVYLHVHPYTPCSVWLYCQPTRTYKTHKLRV